jgi:type I restriction enzyme S subunit
MKAGWKIKCLGDVAKVSAGNSAPQDKSLFKDGVYPFFRTADAGRVRFGEIHKSADYLNDKGIKGLRRYPRGTILFPKSGASTFLNHRVMLGVEGCVSSHLATIIADTTQIEPRFLLYFLSTVAAQDLIQDHAYPSLNLPTIEGIRIQSPSLPEQQRIVHILDEAFEGIATAKANAEKNLQNARALFESHLQSVLSQPGKDWVEMTLESCCEQIFAGGDVPKDHVSQERTPKYSVPIFSNGVKDEGLYGFTDVARVTKPSITVSARGTLGFSAIRTEPFFPVVRLIVLIPDETLIDLSFLYYTVVGMDFGNTGTSIPQLTVPNFKECKLYFPPLSLQKAIVEKLDDLREETQRLESIYKQKLAALEALKKSLLHQAFTGEL